VAAAPDITLRAVRASVEAATSDTTSTGSVDFGPRTARMTPAGRQADRAPVLLTDPLLAVEVLRGATNVVEYGGVEVRGASTIRYQFDVDPTHATLGSLVAGLRRPTFYADAWIDGQGRVRQVLVPADINETRPVRRSSRVPQVITVQFFDYSGEANG
jgi:hypothetical protein